MASECPFSTEKKTQHTTAKPNGNTNFAAAVPANPLLIIRVATLTVLFYYYFFMAILAGNCIISLYVGNIQTAGGEEQLRAPKDDRCSQRELAGTRYKKGEQSSFCFYTSIICIVALVGWVPRTYLFFPFRSKSSFI
ncbi:hypothetical protein DdX_04894 [Ditylenchus destructor]|uniref:Uncharacterized protein n=1 Tax=Ditylenchus destructor TaxID=166010 RepID=A0AAD4NAS5_9BILA|nr:hypothetical protein DdX_04894 [Ditylenchus destructor]